MSITMRWMLAACLLLSGPVFGVAFQSSQEAKTTPGFTTEPELVRKLESAVADGGAEAGVAMLRKTLEAEPRNLPARFFLATAYDATGNPADCIGTAREGIAMKTVDDRLLGILWVCLDETGKQDEAMEVAKNAVRQFPESAESHRWLGISFLRTEQLEDSGKNFERALVLDPTDSTSLYLLAQVYRMSGFTMPSILTYLRFLSVEPTGRRAVKARAQLKEVLKPSLSIVRVQENLAEISLPVGESGAKDEAEFGAAKRALGVYTSPSNREPELTAEKLTKGLDAAFGALPTPDTKTKPAFVTERLIPHFLKAKEAGHIQGLAEIVLLESDTPSERSIAYLEWAASQPWCGTNSAGGRVPRVGTARPARNLALAARKVGGLGGLTLLAGAVVRVVELAEFADTVSGDS